MNRDPFKEYLRQSEPDKQEKGYAWHTAIGLQAVDGLKTSKYLIDTAIKNNELHNRTMHISEAFAQSAKALNSKCNNCTLEEVMILTAIAQNPQITQKELAKVIGKSERTMKSRTVEMQKKGLIVRENGKRNGKWIVLIKI